MYLREKVTLITEVVEDIKSEAEYSVEHLSNVLVSPVRKGHRLDKDGATSANSAVLYYFPEQSITDSSLGVPSFTPGTKVVRGHLAASDVDLDNAWTIESTIEYFSKGEAHHIEVQLV